MINGILGDQNNIKRGVPQRSVRGPIFLILYRVCPISIGTSV